MDFRRWLEDIADPRYMTDIQLKQALGTAPDDRREELEQELVSRNHANAEYAKEHRRKQLSRESTMLRQQLRDIEQSMAGSRRNPGVPIPEDEEERRTLRRKLVKVQQELASL